MSLTKKDIQILMENVHSVIQEAGDDYELPEGQNTFSRDEAYQIFYTALVIAEGALLRASFKIDAEMRAAQISEKLQSKPVIKYPETNVYPTTAPSPLNTSAKPARAKQNA
jgi:hypothetical protein